MADGLPRLLPAPAATSLADHQAHFGALPVVDGRFIAEVERSGLRGRGGAGFPTATKMAAVAKGRRTVVVGNGTEGEPASAKDKALLAYAPHLVLDGLTLAAAAVGAREIFLCIDCVATESLSAAQRALEERGAARLDPVAIQLKASPNKYVAGEERSLVQWLNGGEAKPTFSPPRPFEKGVRGLPTLVQNVETLANLALVARRGADWFRSIGRSAEPGSALVTMSGAVARPGVYEVAFGTPIPRLLEWAGATDVQAVLVGGYFGSWVPAAAVESLRYETKSLRSVGASPAAGAVVVLAGDSCGLIETARVTRWLAGENAGQCGPCMYGLPAIAAAMEQLVHGVDSYRAMADCQRWLGLVTDRGACRHPDGTARFVESGLRVFAHEVELHRLGRCSAAAHTALLPTPAMGAWR